MKRFFLFLIVGILAMSFGCKRREEAMEKADDKTKLEISEGYVTVDEGVELRYKTVGDGPETVVIPAAIYTEYEFAFTVHNAAEKRKDREMKNTYISYPTHSPDYTEKK